MRHDDLTLSRRHVLALGAGGLTAAAVGGLSLSAALADAPRLSVGHHAGASPASPVQPLRALPGGERTLLGRPLLLTLWGSADARACATFERLALDVHLGGSLPPFHAWRLDHVPGTTLSPVRFTAHATPGDLPRLRLRARLRGAAPLETELPFSLEPGRGVLPLREGSYYLAVLPAEASPVRWGRLHTEAAPEGGACTGRLACPEDSLSPLPGALLLTLRVQAADTLARG